MKTSVQTSSRGFSLVEIATAIAVMAVGVLPLVAMLPVGLANSRGNVNRTRGAQLARMVVSTLTSESFTSAIALAPNDAGSSLNLSVAHGVSDPVYFYATYDQRQQPTIVRATDLPASMNGATDLYVLELLVQPTAAANGSSTIPGSAVTVSVYDLNYYRGWQRAHQGDSSSKPTAAFAAQSYVTSLKSVGTLASNANPGS